MNHSYEADSTGVRVKDSRGEIIRDNVDNIEEILRMENYIELLEKSLEENTAKYDKLVIEPNWKAVLKIIFKVLLGIGGVALFAFVADIVQFGGSEWIQETAFGPVSRSLFTVLGCESIAAPAFGFYVQLCWKNYKAVEEEKIECGGMIKFLRNKIKETRSDLELVKQNSQQSTIERAPEVSLETYNKEIQHILDRQLFIARASSSASTLQELESETAQEEQGRPFTMQPRKKGRN